MASATTSVSLIIPCYNEAEGMGAMHDRLAQTLPLLRKYGSVELVLVDDGSSDATYALLRQHFGSWPEVRILHHEHNRGLGAALRTGLAAAQGSIIVTADSDGTYPFSEIPLLLDRLVSGVDLVTASPYHPEGAIENVPAYRVFISKCASLLYRLLIDWRIHTYTALFRAYRREVIEAVYERASHDGFLMVTQLLTEAMLAGYRAAEYPTTLRVRQYGQSKAKIIRITRSHLQYQASLVLRRLGARQRAALPHEAR